MQCSGQMQALKRPGYMANISDPYSIRYPEICAVADVDGKTVELIEEFACTGGAMWAGHNYQKSPLVQSVRVIGNTQRFLLSAGKTTLPLEGSYFPAGIAAVVVTDDEIGITYRGVGGGGVGARSAGQRQKASSGQRATPPAAAGVRLVPKSGCPPGGNG